MKEPTKNLQMKALIQRVKRASVTVNDKVVSSIGKGICVLIGIHKDDKPSDIEYITRKLLNIRLFQDENDKKWQKSVKDLKLEILCVSQFTLYCDLKGNKPDYRHNMKGEEACIFYDTFLSSLKNQYEEKYVKDGIFGAMMDVEIINDGPVTILLETPKSIIEAS